jgi:tetratricopeptide (TPR) repeat protein
MFLGVFPPLFAQNAGSGPVSLGVEIARLERLASGSGRERYDACMLLARLYKLSGNSEEALKACEGALAVSPGDGRAILEQCRLLVSMGEYEKADAALRSLPGSITQPLNAGGRELFTQARYLAAQIAAFRSGNTQPLSALAEDPEFAEYRSGIYYTLWKLTDQASYKTLLSAQFPQSPEAGIASGTVAFAPNPLWLLFPGRDSIVPSAPQPAVPAQSTAPVPSRVLQTGLFSREANANSQAEALRRAGFEPRINPRRVNNNDYWAVTVPGGRDINAEIRKLKDAGFDSFPVANP